MQTPLPRLLLALSLPALLVAAAIGLVRADADWGAPAGADRLLRTIDQDPALQPGDTERAKAMLRARPIDGRAYRVLARVADAQGDKTRADTLYAIAVRRAPRDRLTRAALIDRAFARGDIAGALDQVDALLRVAPSLRDLVLRALLPSLGDARLQAALIDRLATNPPWREALRPVLLDPKTDPQLAEGLLARLTRRTPLTAPETDARIHLLQGLGRAPEARVLWMASLPDAAGQRAALLFDGGFEYPDIAGGYGWRQTPPPGVAIYHDPISPAEGQYALALDFEGRAFTSPGLEQWLALAPARYRLSAAADHRTDTRRPFAWRISCQGGGKALVSLPLPEPSSPAWQRVEADFEVPAGCPGQILRLDFLGRSLADRQLTGTLRLDAVRIQPVRTGAQ